ncbi:DNA mismatch repair protein [Babesia ovis]|uniref:DNA mismatch repair protein n=1 Tax=Babesia ovis TaxID=5869 RepID=A0A9W5TCK4_BABOV|nr:DNA mismatch repair protein [Babesia ovis]
MHTLLLRAKIAARACVANSRRQLVVEVAKCRCFVTATNLEIGTLLQSKLKNLKNAQARDLAARMAQKKICLRGTKPDALAEALSRARARHPGHVIVTQMEDTYEAHGADAILCIEYCGLEPTGDTWHVEIPADQLQNVANTMKLHGIGVTVYNLVSALESDHDEEDTMVVKKTLLFSHDLAPTEGHVTAERNGGKQKGHLAKAFGVTHNKGGYSISTIDLVRRKVEIRERLTLGAALTLLQSADGRVVIFQNGKLPVKKLLMQVPTVLHYEPLQGHSSSEGFHQAACRNIKTRLGITGGFRVAKITSTGLRNPLDRETVAILGLDAECNTRLGKTKGLHGHMLPDSAPTYMKLYMKFLLSHLMPPAVAENVRFLSGRLANIQVPVLDIKPVSAAKVRMLISQYKVDPTWLNTVEETLKAFIYYTKSLAPVVTKKLHEVASGDLNITYKLEKLKTDVEKCLEIVGSGIGDTDVTVTPPITGIDAIDELFNNEETPFGHLHPSGIMRERYQVDHSACQLLDAVTKAYMLPLELEHYDITQVRKRRQEVSSKIRALIDETMVSRGSHQESNIVVNDHFVLLKKVDQVPDHTQLYSVDTIIGNERIRGYVSPAVTEALVNYRNQCTIANTKANEVVTQIIKAMAPYAQAILLAAHFVVVIQTLAAHVGMALSKKWTLPTITSGTEMVWKNLVPLFDEPDDAIPFVVYIDGVHILQGSNNSGRTTLITTILGACIAAQSGLYVPCINGSKLPKYSNIVYYSPLKGSGAGDTSPFAYNIKTLEAVIDNANEESLVLIDDLGSNVDWEHGKAMLSVVATKLLEKGCSAIITTNMGSCIDNESNRLHHNNLVLKNGSLRLGNAEEKFYFQPRLQNSTLLTDILQRVHEYGHQETEHTGAKRQPKIDLDTKSNVDILMAPLEPNLPQESKRVVRLVVQTIEQLHICPNVKNFVHIFPDCIPPPMLNNVPVVYILIIPLLGSTHSFRSEVDSRNVLADGEATVAIYVGESGNLEMRLKAHRAKIKSTVDEYMGNTFMNHEPEMTAYIRSKSDIGNTASLLHWSAAHTIAVKVPTRKDAKTNERRLIKQLYMLQGDIVLLSQQDGVYRELAAID